MAGEEVYIARFGAWLARALGSTGAFAEDLNTDGLGIRMPDAVVSNPAVQAAGHALADASSLLTQGADALEAAMTSGDEGELIAAIIQLSDGLYEYFDSGRQLVSKVEALVPGIADPAERTSVQNFVAVMARRMIDYLVVSVLELRTPRFTYLLKVLGLVDWEAIDANPADALSRPYIRKVLHLERFKDLVKNPVGHFTNVFGWGTPGFDPFPFFRAAADYFHPEASFTFGKVGPDAFIEKGPFRWSRDSSVNPPGLMLDISANLSKTLSGRSAFSADWGAGLDSTLAFEGGVIGRLKPPFSVSVAPKAASVSGDLSLAVNRNENARHFSIVGGNSLVTLTGEDVSVGAGIVVGAGTASAIEIEPRAFSDIKGLTLKLGSKDADSFLASLLSGADIEGRFEIGLEYRLKEGLVVKAAGGLEIAIPMHQSLGFVDFETLFLMLRVNDNGSLTLETSAGIKGQIGPLSASVERMGVQIDFNFVSGADAKYGPVDLALKFKPPTGVGLALDAGVIRGGGYLYLDFDKGEYAGALELTFAEFLALKAIGLINTKMPDGSKGFSLLIIITAEFGTPLQLGFGFTLNAVGGLLGLNRTMKLDELAAGVKNGSIQSVMFPQNVIANAPQIISDLRRFFPPENGTFLIGPMARLGWGTPTLVSISLGIIIEIPPGNIAIVGVLKVALPDEDAALLVLQVNFIGALEVDKQRLWFFASMYESRVLWIPLGGDMGLLIAWGDDAEFVISVGGFHPAFKPPPLPFPNPDRVSISILDEPLARIRVNGYFAVTSNTAQFGASVDLFFGLDDFSVEGHIGFDALFQFSPFYFNITFSASLSVKVFGAGLFSVRVRGELEGTSPWHVEGEGSISLLFWDIDIPFSHTWGESANTTLPAIEALPILASEFNKPANCTALPPRGGRLSVSLRKLEASDELVLHPVGVLRISQRAVPLDLSIQKVGNQPVSDITIATLKTEVAGLRRVDDVSEPFATAQFRDLDQAAKLSAPSFEPQNAGVDLTAEGNTVATSHAVKRVVFHELIIIDNNYKEHLVKFFAIGIELFIHLLKGNSAARARYSAMEKKARVPFDDKVVAMPTGFVVASTADNSFAASATRFASQAKAQDFMAAQVKQNPAMRDALHVIPEAEAKLAA
jgi:hypothetical protein